MIKNSTKWFAILGGATLAAVTAAQAQDSGALLDALVKKGVLNDQEAEEIRADLTNDFHGTPWAIAGGKSTKSLKVSGRLQTQYYALSSDRAATASNNVSGFLLRRVYLGFDANIGPEWSASVHYNFADNTFDKAYATWDGDEIFGQDITFDVGLRKVNFGFEETTSSGSLKAIERSGVTRYFVEDTNGRRLGAGSYHIGAFMEGNKSARKGKDTGVYYGAAITNITRQSASGTGAGTVGAGNTDANDTVGYWVDAGYSYKVGDVKGTFGAAYSFLPDMGGVIAAAGGSTPGSDFQGLSIYANGNIGKFTLEAEYLHADVENGAGAGNDANPWGYWIQPSFMATDKIELVGRYSYTDSGGRSIRTSDGIRTAPGGLNGTELTEYYLGVNFLFSGRDAMLQLGYVGGKSENAAGAEEQVSGVRSQLQLNF